VEACNRTRNTAGGSTVTSRSIEALVLGIGNVLWADEGFGVRAVESLHEAYEAPDGVLLLDGGTQGLYLMQYITSCRRLILFDAIDFGLAPGTLRVLRGEEVPAWGRTKLSAHQTGFNDLLGLATINGQAPEEIVLIGVQPVELSDFGGSLRDAVRHRLPEAIAIAVAQLETWGLPLRRRIQDAPREGLVSAALSLQAYEDGRPRESSACRTGDARFLSDARGAD
jgi:hydrogenase maturation protease